MFTVKDDVDFSFIVYLMITLRNPWFMLTKEEKGDLGQVWASHDSYGKQMQVNYALHKKDRKARNPDDVIR